MTTQYASNFNDTEPFSDTGCQLNLATNVNQSYTVPGNGSNKYKARFEFNVTSNIFVGLNVTATSPGEGLNTTTNNLEFISRSRYVKGGDVLSFISPDASGAYVSVSLLALPG